MNELGLLYHYLPTELAPPDEAWSRLVKVLDDDERNVFKEMETFEIPPPIAAWENIAFALEADVPKTNLSFGETCLGMEIPPPAFIWEEIEKSLDASEKPIQKIGGKSTIIRMVAVGLAIAACLTGIVVSVLNQHDNQTITKKIATATINKKQTTVQSNHTSSNLNIQNNQPAQIVATNQTANKRADNNPTLSTGDSLTDSERELNLKKYNWVAVADLNTTNNKVTSKTDKLKDINGNVIYKLEDYATGGNYIASIGPNGNSVNVSTKLSNMVEFFQEDSTTSKPEEYLDKVMRESNVWRQKFIDWRKKVDAADADPSQMNFIDPIDLMRFFQKNR